MIIKTEVKTSPITRCQMHKKKAKEERLVSNQLIWSLPASINHGAICSAPEKQKPHTLQTFWIFFSFLFEIFSFKIRTVNPCFFFLSYIYIYIYLLKRSLDLLLTFLSLQDRNHSPANAFNQPSVYLLSFLTSKST